jgi:hypothetical protein
MAHPRTRGQGAAESLMHVACAIAVVVIVYILAGFIGDGAIAATRYWSG